MPLTLRERFSLKVSLANRYDQPGDVKRIAKASGIGNLINISLDGTALDRWEAIIQAAEVQNRLVGLVQTVLNENADDTDCRAWLDELTNGVPTRVQKLARSIADGQCVLFLGPGTLLCNVQNPFTPEDESLKLTVFSHAFARSLAKELYDNNVYYDSRAETNLAYIAQRYNDLRLPGTDKFVRDIIGIQGKLAQSFYKSSEPNTRLHELVAKLPFRVVINTNPDGELAAVLNEQPLPAPNNPGKSIPRCVHRYYNITNADGMARSNPNPLEPGQTLLYNIFGWFEDRPSMILTESQLLDFTNRVLNKDPALDPQVINEFTVTDANPKSYLFLGFDFDQWYVKIMFQTVLKLIKQKDRAFSIFPKGVAYNQFNREFFEEEFKCYFIDEDLTKTNPDGFLEQLIIAYTELVPAP
ncbi:hypothetical protein GCM10027592_17260 [Spirosoma flavus]